MHLSLPALLLSLLYATAIALALVAPGAHPVAGVVVLAGLAGRWALRHHGRVPTVVPGDPVPSPASPA